MAHQESAIERRKAELIAALDDTRFQLTRDVSGVADRLDLPSRILDSLHSHQWKWVAGSLGVGALAGLLALPLGRKGKGGEGKSSMLGWTLRTLLRGGITLAEPALFSFAQEQLRKRSNVSPGSDGG